MALVVRKLASWGEENGGEGKIEVPGITPDIKNGS